jgi:hypothetical protein
VTDKAGNDGSPETGLGLGAGDQTSSDERELPVA